MVTGTIIWLGSKTEKNLKLKTKLKAWEFLCPCEPRNVTGGRFSTLATKPGLQGPSLCHEAFTGANVSRDENIAAIQKSAQQLGHVPSRAELLENTEISIFKLHKHFGQYRNALEACGLERHGCGYRIEMSELFQDWARVTRKIGRIPSMLDYPRHGKYTTKALTR